jgi:hypothetical protein
VFSLDILSHRMSEMASLRQSPEGKKRPPNSQRLGAVSFGGAGFYFFQCRRSGGAPLLAVFEKWDFSFVGLTVNHIREANP